MFATTSIILCFTFLNFLVLCRCAPELPAEDSYGIIVTERAIRNTVNNLFSTLKLKVLHQKLKLKQYSTIHNFFISITLRDHDNLKKIAKLTHVDTIDNGTQVFITQLNEVLNEDHKNDEATDSVYVTILIKDFLSKLENLKERNSLKNNTKFDLNKAIIRHFRNNEKEFGNTSYLQEFVKGNDSDDDVLSNNAFWQSSGRRIFEGKSSNIDRFPFMVSVQFFEKFQCGGSIIKSDLVITSASCLQIAWNNRFFRENPAFLSVQVGSTYYERGGENIPIVEIEYHPGFNPKNLRHNLALMRLTRELNFRKKYRKLKKIDFDRHPWPLPSNTDGIVVVGWGAKTLGNKVDVNWKNALSYSTLDFYPLDECQDVYTKEFVTDRNFCAGFFSKGGGACNHDAGGPGVSSGILVGVISFGSPQCGAPDAPTVFTKLGYYTDWIEKIMEMKMVTGRQPTTHRLPNINPTFPVMTTTARLKIAPIIRGQKPFQLTPIPEFDLLRASDKKHDFRQFFKTIFKMKKQPKKQREQHQKQIVQKQTQEEERQKEEKRQQEEKRQEEKERQQAEERQKQKKQRQEKEERQQEKVQLKEEEERQEEKRQEEKEPQEEKERQQEEERQKQKEQRQEKEDRQQEKVEIQEEEERYEEKRQEEEEIEEVTEKEKVTTQAIKKGKKVKPKQALRNKLETEIKKEDKLYLSETQKKSKRKEPMTWTAESQSHSEEIWNDKTTTIWPFTIFGSNIAKATILHDNLDASSAEITSYEELTPSFKLRNDGNKEPSSGHEKDFDEVIDSLLDNLNINYIMESKESLYVDPQLIRTKNLKYNPNLTTLSKKKGKKPSSVVENKNLNANEEDESDANNGSVIEGDTGEDEGDVKYDTNEYENNEQSVSDKKSVEIANRSPSANNVESHSNDNHENKHHKEVVHTVNKNNEMKDYEKDDGDGTYDGDGTDEQFETLNILAESLEQENSSSNSTARLLEMLDYEDLYNLLSEYPK